MRQEMRGQLAGDGKHRSLKIEQQEIEERKNVLERNAKSVSKKISSIKLRKNSTHKKVINSPSGL